MRIPFDKTRYKEMLTSAPDEVTNSIISIDDDPTITAIADEYKLDPVLTGELVHEIMLVIFGFCTTDELVISLAEMLKVSEEEAGVVYKEIDHGIFEQFRGYFNSQQEKLTGDYSGKSLTPKMLTPDLDKNKILDGIENPKTSILANTTVTVKAGEQTNGALGGFAAAESNTNPAAPIAAKLDEKFSAPSVSASKEVYQIKKPDPYHEPI